MEKREKQDFKKGMIYIMLGERRNWEKINVK